MGLPYEQNYLKLLVDQNKLTPKVPTPLQGLTHYAYNPAAAGMRAVAGFGGNVAHAMFQPDTRTDQQRNEDGVSAVREMVTGLGTSPDAFRLGVPTPSGTAPMVSFNFGGKPATDPTSFAKPPAPAAAPKATPKPQAEPLKPQGDVVAPKAPPAAMAPAPIPMLQMPAMPQLHVTDLGEALQNSGGLDPRHMGDVIAGQTVAGAQMQRDDANNATQMEQHRLLTSALPAFANANTAMQKAPSDIAQNQASANYYNTHSDQLKAQIAQMPDELLVKFLAAKGGSGAGTNATGMDHDKRMTTIMSVDQALQGELTPADRERYLAYRKSLEAEWQGIPQKGSVPSKTPTPLHPLVRG